MTPAKMYRNWDFWFETIKPRNPACGGLSGGVNNRGSNNILNFCDILEVDIMEVDNAT
jgi:hypothetical protein